MPEAAAASRTVTVGSHPYAAGVGPTTDTAYVANTGSDNVSVIAPPHVPAAPTLTSAIVPRTISEHLADLETSSPGLSGGW